MSDNLKRWPIYRCSFCGKLGAEVEKLIAGPVAMICNECIDLCNEILTEEGRKPSLAQLQAWGLC